MPKVEASLSDLKSLIGRDLSIGELEEMLMLGKTELDEIDGDKIKLDFKDTNRPDLWSVEGVARQIRYKLGQKPYLPDVKKSGHKVLVSEEMRNARPYTLSFITKGVKWTEESLSQFIQMQEKLSGSFGLKRRDVAIGAYRYDMISWPITFKLDRKPFAPLGFDREMSPEEILSQHPKGKEYGHLLDGMEKYPMFIDSEGKVLSMPPIINSNDVGNITLDVENVFVEASGFSLDKISTAIQVMAAALYDRGAEIYSVETIYPDFSKISPDFHWKEFEADLGRIVEFSGLALTGAEAKKLLEEYGYSVGGKLLYPSYRNDIMHWRDVAEDLLISYGYGNINPEPPEIFTIGGNSAETEKENMLSEAMVGLGFQEAMTFVLSNPDKDSLYGLVEKDQARIANPMSSLFSSMRSWLLPSLLEFESRNQRREYPHLVFESGDVVVPDKSEETGTRTEKKLAGYISKNRANYGEITGALSRLFSLLGKELSLKARDFPWSIPGRSAVVLSNGKEAGFVCEIHPRVLEKFGIEFPVAYFELDEGRV